MNDSFFKVETEHDIINKMITFIKKVSKYGRIFHNLYTSLLRSLYVLGKEDTFFVMRKKQVSRKNCRSTSVSCNRTRKNKKARYIICECIQCDCYVFYHWTMYRIFLYTITAPIMTFLDYRLL